MSKRKLEDADEGQGAVSGNLAPVQRIARAFLLDWDGTDRLRRRSS